MLMTLSTIMSLQLRYTDTLFTEQEVSISSLFLHYIASLCCMCAGACLLYRVKLSNV